MQVPKRSSRAPRVFAPVALDSSHPTAATRRPARSKTSAVSVDRPVRRVVTRSGRGIRGKFPSLKLGEMVAWESPLEADAIRLFEFNVGVAHYCAQPSWEVYQDAAGNVHSFVPDFRVELVAGGSLLVEVKSDADAAYPPTARVLGLKAMAMQAQGKRYRVLTPRQIREQPRFGNLKELERCAKGPLDDDVIQSLNGLDRGTTFTVQEIALALGSTEMVYRAIAHGRLRTDLQRTLNTESLVWHPDNREAGDGSFPI